MAMTCPPGFDVEQLNAEVQSTYRRVATTPQADFHFHRGGEYAVRMLRYSEQEVAQVPAISRERFAGVGNPLRVGGLREGQTVLDHACGAGMDLLLAARQVGPSGMAIGVDLTPEMVGCARTGAMEAGLADRVKIFQGRYEALPVEDQSVDVVISNGVLNLAPNKWKVLKEVVRVLKPGGRLFLSDVVVGRELRLETRQNPILWAACVAGALTVHELLEVATAAGLSEARVTERFDCFRGTSAEQRVSKALGLSSANLYAEKSARAN